jgi:hypothetical protein
VSVEKESKRLTGIEERAKMNILKDCYPAALSGLDPQTTASPRMSRQGAMMERTKRKRACSELGLALPYEHGKGLSVSFRRFLRSTA